MADTTIKGDGLKFNVRSYKLERLIDFSKVSLAKETEYELGDLPRGFVPRMAAVVELKSPSATATVVATVGAGKASRTVGADKGYTAAAVTGVHLTDETVAVTLSTSAELADGIVKVVLAGDVMTGAFDDGLGRDAFDPKDYVPDTTVG
jgi:hypothetical protein